MDAKTRQMEIDLMTLGTGVILFGLWSIVRTALTLFIFDDEIKELVEPEMRTPVYIFVFVFMSLVALLLVYTGFTARSVGKGKQKSILYLIVGGFSILIYLLSIIIGISSIFTENDQGLLSMIASLLIDVTSIVCTLQMMIYGIRLRRIRKAEAVTAKGGAA